MRTPISRHIGNICLVLFAVSTAFPIVASVLGQEPIPAWLGVADVLVAASLVSVAIAVAVRCRRKVTDADRVSAWRITESVIALIPALLAVFFVAPRWFNWPVLVVGLAWRSWLLLYTLPFLFAARRSASGFRASNAR